MDTAMKKVKSGDYTQKIDITTKDELKIWQLVYFMTKEIKWYHDLQIDKIIEEQTKTEAIIFSIEDGIILTDFKGNIIFVMNRLRINLVFQISFLKVKILEIFYHTRK